MREIAEASLVSEQPLGLGVSRAHLVENGGWALFITTSRGHNHAYSILGMAQREPGWHAERTGT